MVDIKGRYSLWKFIETTGMVTKQTTPGPSQLLASLWLHAGDMQPDTLTKTVGLVDSTLVVLLVLVLSSDLILSSSLKHLL
jgi:hypothetical protein